MTLYGMGIVVAGFVAMAITVGLGSALVQRLAGQAAQPRPARPSSAHEGSSPATNGQLATDFVVGMVAAGLGGTLVAALAPGAHLTHSVVLAGLVLAMSVVCLVRPGEGVPRWYMAVLSLASAVVIVFIGWIADNHA